MAFYRAVFVKADVKSEVELKPTYTLVGKSREDAESEALRLPRPRGANFVKLLREGLYEAPRVVFALYRLEFRQHDGRCRMRHRPLFVFRSESQPFMLATQ